MHTLTKHKSKTWAALILSGMLLFTMNTTGYAAASTESMPKPAWTSSSLMLSEANTEKDVLIKGIHAVPSKNLVYVHASQPVTKTSSKTTLDWQLDSLQAFDVTTGQLKWNTIFHEKSGPYTTYPIRYMPATVQLMCIWNIQTKPKNCTHSIHPVKPTGSKR